MSGVTLETAEMMLRYVAKAGGKTVSSKELASVFGIRDAEANPSTREALKTAMRTIGKAEGLPIGADTRGYILITTYDELVEYLAVLQGRIMGIQERIKLVREAWGNTRPHQKDLFPDDE